MILVLALLQEVFERADREFRPFAGTIRVERARGDAATVLEGRIELSADRELRLELRGIRAEELPGLEVWRRPWSGLRADYAFSEERPAEPEGAVRGADGAPIPPVKARLRRGPAVALSEADERAVWVLTPKSGGPRLKVWFDVATLRAERVAWDTRTGAVAVTLDGGAGPGPTDGPGPRKHGVDSEDRR